MIVYRTTHDAIDLSELAVLFTSAGWGWRAADPGKLAAMVDGSRFVVSAHDEDSDGPPWSSPSSPRSRQSEPGRLVGFARAISDGVTNAYVSAVAVLPEHRGKGIGRELMRRLLEGRPGIRFILHSAQGVHDFYRKFGFEDASDMMRRERRTEP